MKTRCPDESTFESWRPSLQVLFAKPCPVCGAEAPEAKILLMEFDEIKGVPARWHLYLVTG